MTGIKLTDYFASMSNKVFFNFRIIIYSNNFVRILQMGLNCTNGHFSFGDILEKI